MGGTRDDEAKKRWHLREFAYRDMKKKSFFSFTYLFFTPFGIQYSAHLQFMQSLKNDAHFLPKNSLVHTFLYDMWYSAHFFRKTIQIESGWDLQLISTKKKFIKKNLQFQSSYCNNCSLLLVNLFLTLVRLNLVIFFNITFSSLPLGFIQCNYWSQHRKLKLIENILF